MAKILLLGDSIIAHMPNNLIGTENDEVINAGVENVDIESCHKYVWPKVSDKDINSVVLLIGLNNILKTDCETLNDIIKKMIDFINELNTLYDLIIVQSVYPTRNKEINQKIQIFNDIIYEYCYQLEIEYLDIYELLTDKDGFLKETYTNDGIHLNEFGYNLIANQINEEFLMLNDDYLK